MRHDGIMSTDGEVANALVCKTSIHGFKSHSVLHKFNNVRRVWRSRQASLTTVRPRPGLEISHSPARAKRTVTRVGLAVVRLETQGDLAEVRSTFAACPTVWPVAAVIEHAVVTAKVDTPHTFVVFADYSMDLAITFPSLAGAAVGSFRQSAQGVDKMPQLFFSAAGPRCYAGHLRGHLCLSESWWSLSMAI